MQTFRKLKKTNWLIILTLQLPQKPSLNKLLLSSKRQHLVFKNFTPPPTGLKKVIIQF